MSYTDNDRFSSYRQITARRAGPASCGDGAHTVQIGDTIGYNRRARRPIICQSCWLTWKDENREADIYESSLMY